MDLTQQKINDKRLIKRIFWTFAIGFVYMFGRSLPIATVPTAALVFKDSLTRNAIKSMAAITGGQLSNFTLFSLGLGPWMTSMIILRFFSVMGWTKKQTTARQRFYRLLLMLFIAVLQATAITIRVPFMAVSILGTESMFMGRLVTVVTLVTGAYVLMWLGEQNGRLGLGGSMLIILINMILSFVGGLTSYKNLYHFTGLELWWRVGLTVVIVTALIFIMVLTYRAEYRIKIRRIAIHNELAAESYIPIRLNPAGAMPFMYGMSLMMLPPIVISWLLQIYKNNAILMFLYQNMGFRSVVGVAFYSILLYVLSIGFAYYNYDAYEIAKTMRRSGDYIEGIRPGKPTQEYLHKYISFFAQVGAVFIISMSAIPMMIIAIQKSESVSLAFLISNLFIIISFVFGIVEQVRSLRSWKQYKDLI